MMSTPEDKLLKKTRAQLSRKKVANYVKSRNRILPEYNFGQIQVVVKDPVINDIDLASVFA